MGLFGVVGWLWLLVGFWFFEGVLGSFVCFVVRGALGSLLVARWGSGWRCGWWWLLYATAVSVDRVSRRGEVGCLRQYVVSQERWLIELEREKLAPEG